MIIFSFSVGEGLYQYNWICHKCANINEVYQWQSSLYEEEDEIEVNCCKTIDTLFKYTINFNNKKLFWRNNTIHTLLYKIILYYFICTLYI